MPFVDLADFTPRDLPATVVAFAPRIEALAEAQAAGRHQVPGT